MNVSNILNSFAATVLGLLFSISASAAEYPASQFSTSTNKVWKIVQENEDASVLFKDNSKYKETIVLRVFDQTTNSKDRIEAFKTSLSKITEARNRLLEISGGGAPRYT